MDQALETVKHLASRPLAILYSFALLASLEQLANCARESDHPQRKRFEAILKQCRPLTHLNILLQVVLQLLGDKEERDVAAKIRKMLEGNSPARGSAPEPVYDCGGPSPHASYAGRYFGGHGRPFGPYFNSDRALPRPCSCCRKVGNFARNCPLDRQAVKNMIFYGFHF